MKAMTRDYVAGYLDGEGCFYSTLEGRVCVSVSNTHVGTLLELRDFFGYGTVGRKKVYHRGKPAFQWRCYGENAAECALEMAPFLHEKAPQAVLLNEIHWCPRGTLRDGLVLALREMKMVHHDL